MSKEIHATCADCIYCAKTHCYKWDTVIPSYAAAQDCTAYRARSKTKSGKNVAERRAERRAAIRRKKAEKLGKRNKIKPEQENIVQFVEFKEYEIERIDGKYKPTGKVHHGHGLQVKNRIYLADGSYKLVNRSSLKIKKTYSDLPGWANDFLRDKYRSLTEGEKSSR